MRSHGAKVEINKQRLRDLKWNFDMVIFYHQDNTHTLTHTCAHTVRKRANLGLMAMKIEGEEKSFTIKMSVHLQQRSINY